ncbi:hypothetical protein T484DRAFT_3548428 [Baffinella frigidus]|nr:hypothetical protein T484DRAFT_3548428 [Cryptophyta sp. CCMP2293]
MFTMRSVVVGVLACATGASAFSVGPALPSLSRVTSSKCSVEMNAAVKLIPKIRQLGNSPRSVPPTKAMTDASYTKGTSTFFGGERPQESRSREDYPLPESALPSPRVCMRGRAGGGQYHAGCAHRTCLKCP